MRIRKFFENELQGPQGITNLSNDISSERVEEIVREILTLLDKFQEGQTKLKKFEEELSKYRNKSKKGNDQIDDTVIEIQQVNKSLEIDVQSKLDNIIEKMKDYIDNGRNYIYSE